MSWVVLAAFAYVATVSPLVIARLTVLAPRNRESRPVTTFAVYLIASASRAITIATIGLITGILPDRELLLIALTTPVHVIVWLALISHVTDAVTRHRRAVRTLLGVRSTLEKKGTHIAVLVKRQREKAVATIRRELAPSLLVIRDAVRTGLSRETSDLLLGQLSATIENVVRPLSEKLISPNDDEFVSPQVAVTARSIKRFLPSSVIVKTVNAPVLVVAITAYCGLLPGVRAYGWGLVAVLLLPALCLVLAAGYALNLFVGDRRVNLIEAASLIGISYAVASLLGVAWTSIIAPSIAPIVPLQMTAIIVLTASAVAIYRVFLLGLEDLEIELSDANDALLRRNAELRQRLWVERSALATTLHGPVQAAFHVAAIRISTSPQLCSDDLRLIETQLSEAVTQLAAPESLTRKRFEDALAQVRSLWSSISEVTTSIDAGFLASIDEFPGSARCVLEIIREAVTNANKHARAKVIRVRVTREAEIASLEVTNDGRTTTGAKLGVGLRLLDELCLSWELRHSLGTTTLSAHVPLTHSTFG